VRDGNSTTFIKLTASIVSSYVGNNSVAAADLPG
jgi:predicted transcriptional regulator